MDQLEQAQRAWKRFKRGEVIRQLAALALTLFLIWFGLSMIPDGLNYDTAALAVFVIIGACTVANFLCRLWKLDD